MFKTKKEEHITELYKPQQIEIKLEPQPENKLNESEKESIIYVTSILNDIGIFSLVVTIPPPQDKT